MARWQMARWQMERGKPLFVCYGRWAVGGSDPRAQAIGERRPGGLEAGAGVAQDGLHAGDGAIGEAAGDDEAEVGEVGGDVEGQAVGGDPLADADAHGGDLGGRTIGGRDPDAGGFGVALAGDAVGGEGVDDGLLEESHVAVEAQGLAGVWVDESCEVEDGVGDDLAGAVVGDVAASVGLVELDTEGGEALGVGEDVIRGTLAAGDGDDGRVLDEVDGAQVAGGIAPGFDELGLAGALDCEGVLVGHAAQVDGV